MPKAITCGCGCQEWYLLVDNADEPIEIRCAAVASGSSAP